MILVVFPVRLTPFINSPSSDVSIPAFSAFFQLGNQSYEQLGQPQATWIFGVALKD